MRKLPAFQFYPGDWLKDTEVHMLSFEARGIWFEMLCYMWTANERGKLEGTLPQLSRLIGCSEVQLRSSLLEFSVTKTATVTECNDSDNAIVTIINRRMHREEKERKSSTCRVKRYREVHKQQDCNAHDNDEITTPSSSSSSFSSSKQENHRPSIEDVMAYCQERKNTIDPQKWFDYYTSNGWKVGRNPMKDWKAAVRTWEKNGFGGSHGSKNGSIGGTRGESFAERRDRERRERHEKVKRGEL